MADTTPNDLKRKADEMTSGDDSTEKREAQLVYVKPKGKAGQLHPVWRMSFPDDEDATGRGKVEEGLPGYGVWRRVPGFSKILASDQGHIMTEGAARVRKLTQSKHTYYWSAGCNGRHEKVHLLVTRAFEGPAQPWHISVDHRSGKELPPEVRHSDNRASNLAWATHKEQRANQKKPKPQSTGEPCVVWRVQGTKLKGNRTGYDMTLIGSEVSYPSSTEAATALGLHHGALSRIFHGKAKTTATKEGVRYTGRHAERDDTDLNGEAWKKHSLRLRVSNHGRIQTKKSQRWGPKRFASELDGQDYMTVGVEGKKLCIHVLVGELFFVGPRPLHWKVWDHIDTNRSNCHITNLHPVTAEENGLNTARQRNFYLWKVDAPDDKILCRSQNGAAREHGLDRGHLGDVLHQRKGKGGYVIKTVNGYRAAWADEVDAREVASVLERVMAQVEAA